MEQPLVSIACITYNQAKYIRQCLDGFVMQITTFPVEIVIHDDASTDGTQDIIMEYVEKYPQFQWKPILQKENQYSKGNGILVPYVYPNCIGKYVALCEGDDYWTDPMKLQKQVDFLDTHPEYGVVHTDFSLTQGKRHHTTVEYPDGKAFPDALTRGIHIGTLTSMFRLSTYNKLPKYFVGKGWPMGDYPLWIEIAHISKIHYIPEVTACYRILEQSASHSQDFQKLLNFYNSFCEIRKFYIEKFNVDEYVDIHSSTYYETIVRYACRLGCKDEARKYYHEAKIHGKVTRKCTLFYWATLIPILKYIIELYIKI